MNKRYVSLFDVGSSLFDQVAQNTGYPPYNIKKVSDGKFLIEFAVAGYDIGDLEVSMDKDVLTVTGKKTTQTDLSAYLYKGISSKSFSKDFSLGQSFVVNNVEMFNGVLKIFLDAVAQKTTKQVYEINVAQPSATNHPTLLNEDSNI
jgi:molecular chaperone IbpA